MTKLEYYEVCSIVTGSEFEDLINSRKAMLEKHLRRYKFQKIA